MVLFIAVHAGPTELGGLGGLDSGAGSGARGGREAGGVGKVQGLRRSEHRNSHGILMETSREDTRPIA